MVYEHSCTWRYTYNAGKSAVLVHGENKREHNYGSKYRTFLLGSEKVKERIEYDHVGVKNCLFGNAMPRTLDKISRGRRTFNAATCIGVKKKGLSMNVCSTLFWSIIAPTVTYGCELWVLRADEKEALNKFQRYMGRKCQRLPSRSPNYSAYLPLGWLSLIRYISAKKLLFLRTIIVMNEMAVCKRILVSRAEDFLQDIDKGSRNEFESPIFEMLKTAHEFGILEICTYMINPVRPLSIHDKRL